MKNQSYKMLIFGTLSFFIAAVFIMFPEGKIYAQQSISIKIDKWFHNSQVIFPFVKTKRIYSLAIGGSIQLHEDNSLIRVILVGDNFHEYLVYEAYPLIVDNNSLNIINECEETCILEGITPHSLKIELIEATLQIDEVDLTDYPPRLKMETAGAQSQIKKERYADKIKKINEYIKKKGLKWIAGETSVSRLSYEEKKKLFGRDKVPNLQGAEFYKGGIFELKSKIDSSLFSIDAGSSLIESFDWRNRHGANNPDSPYYDGDATGSGWFTPVTHQGCADCWAHSAVGVTEALANLYFNQHIDVAYGLDLSVQDVLSCSGAGSCSGGSPGGALYYIANTGIVDEACFPYAGSDETCDDKCVDPDEKIWINGQNYINPSDGEDNIKRNLIDHGPLNFGISSWWHSMCLVGYDKDSDDSQTIWILKNSWGTSWGENGYGRIKVDLTDVYLLYTLQTPVTSIITPFEIACNDSDSDGYFNWGISEDIPSSCPNNISYEKDCDDSNSYLGPFDSNGYCSIIEPQLVEIVNVSTGKDYLLAHAESGATPYIDRDYTITEISSILDGGVLVKTANDDKNVTGANHLILRLLKDAPLYVCYDKRGALTPPDWLDDGSWTLASETITTTDGAASPMWVYSKGVAGGETISLGGNHYGGDTGARSNYFVIAKPKVTPILVEITYVSSKKAYTTAAAELTAMPYIDRSYEINYLTESLKDWVLVRTANDDKYIAVEKHLGLRMTDDAVVYVSYDQRGSDSPPCWLDGWQRSNQLVGTTDAAASPMVLFSSCVSAGSEIFLGGNQYCGGEAANSNYFVVVQPVSALLTIAQVSSGRPYELGCADVGMQPYIDRSYTITHFNGGNPNRGLSSGVLIRTANDDKFINAEEHLNIDFHQEVDVFACYDRRGNNLPNWLQTWQEFNVVVTTTDSVASPMNVYLQNYGPIRIWLGGNHEGGDTGARSNYFVVVQP